MKKLLVLGLLAGSSMFAATHFSIGVGIGTPAPVYTAPAYGYGYTAPAYGYGYTAPVYVAPRYNWDRDHYRRDRDHDRDNRWNNRNDFRRDTHNDRRH